MRIILTIITYLEDKLISFTRQRWTSKQPYNPKHLKKWLLKRNKPQSSSLDSLMFSTRDRSMFKFRSFCK